MPITTTRAQRRQLARDNAKLPAHLVEVPRRDWPNQNGPQLSVWRSRDYLVQVLPEPHAVARLSINRTSLSGDRWQDHITWDDLQRLKGECGFGDHFAVEVFPADSEVVNVANMRHLWVLEAAPAFAWSRARA